MNSIRTALLKISGVIAVDISKEEDKVTISGVAVDKEELVMKLASLGYPEKGNNNLMSKARSFVSCAIGKVS